MKFLALIEPTPTGYSASVPDLDGCGATAGTREEVIANLAIDIQTHLEGMKEDGIPIPEPTSTAEWIDVPGV